MQYLESADMLMIMMTKVRDHKVRERVCLSPAVSIEYADMLMIMMTKVRENVPISSSI